MTLQCLHALTARNNHAGTFVVDFVTDNLRNLGHVLWQGNDDFQVFVAEAQSAADGFELVRTGRILSARHTRRQVVTDDDGDVGILIDGIEQTRHTAVGKRRVSDNGYGRPLAGIGSTLGHRNRGTHIDTRVDGTEGRQEAQRVATDVAEDTGILIFFQHLVQCSIHIAVTTTLTQCGGTWSHVGTGVEALTALHAQCFLHDIGVQFTRAGQGAVELT